MELTVLAKAFLLGFGILGPAIGLGMVFSKALEGISRNPEGMKDYIWVIFVGAGMIEVFGLIAAGFFFLLK